MITSNLPEYSSKTVKAKVEIYDGSTLVANCTCTASPSSTYPGEGALSHFVMSREGELGKFFGFGVSHKLEMVIIDLEKVLRLYEGFTTKVCLGNGSIWDCPYPTLDVIDIKVDKKSGDIKLTACDILYKASELTLSDLAFPPPYSLRQLATAIATALGVNVRGMDSAFDLSYTQGGNYSGTESLRNILTHIAEVTQTIYYINSNDELVFKRLSSNPVYEYDRTHYYEFEVAAAKKLKGICNATELGDNLTNEAAEVVGVIQYIRNNPLWELRDDIGDLLIDALHRVGGMELQQYELDWSGDYRLEIGDCITIYYDDDATKVHILNDVLTYGGAMDEESSWEYLNNDGETFSNALNVVDKINQTFAKVDKVEKNITLYVGEVVDEIVPVKVEEALADFDFDVDLSGIEGDIEDLKATTKTNTQKVAQLELTTDNISQRVSTEESKTTTIENSLGEIQATLSNHESSIGELVVSDSNIIASVEKVKESTVTSVGALNDEVEKLAKKVSATMTEEQVEIKISESLENGIDKVTTSTGFTFDDEGLHISKSTSEMESLLDEQGLQVSRYDTPVLTAKADGVNALNITVRQYFKIGGSRFEKYGNRVGCFWTGE